MQNGFPIEHFESDSVQFFSILYFCGDHIEKVFNDHKTRDKNICNHVYQNNYRGYIQILKAMQDRVVVGMTFFEVLGKKDRKKNIMGMAQRKFWFNFYLFEKIYLCQI